MSSLVTGHLRIHFPLNYLQLAICKLVTQLPSGHGVVWACFAFSSLELGGNLLFCTYPFQFSFSSLTQDCNCLQLPQKLVKWPYSCSTQLQLLSWPSADAIPVCFYLSTFPCHASPLMLQCFKLQSKCVLSLQMIWSVDWVSTHRRCRRAHEIKKST